MDEIPLTYSLFWDNRPGFNPFTFYFDGETIRRQLDEIELALWTEWLVRGRC